MLFSVIRKMSYRILDQGSFGLTDSCQGDSGGPIWRLVDNPLYGNNQQAIIVGLVKMGRGKLHIIFSDFLPVTYLSHSHNVFWASLLH